MNYSISELTKYDSYSLRSNQKIKIFKKKIKELTNYHYKYCRDYQNIINFFNISFKNEIYPPFIHTSIFKNIDIKTVKNKASTKVFKSSGTSSSVLSKIHLDFETSLIQSKTLQILFNHFFKKKKFDKLIILENKNTFKKNNYNARSAAIKGLIQIIPNHEFLLNNEHEVDKKKLLKIKNSNNLIFGFTFMVWQNLIDFLKVNKLKINLSNSYLLHGGGWKKMIDKSVSTKQFKKKISQFTQIKNIHDYYGMIEQTGSVYFECEKGFFHTSIFSDIIIRNKNLKIEKFNKRGLIQTLSLLPKSYPGHNLLTEDVGEIFGEDNCKCGRKGKIFKVYGRVKNAELRGCSNV